jgi:hypothetical protein
VQQAVIEAYMSDQRPTRETMSIEEATVSNMWEIAAIGEVLERKNLCSKQELRTIIDELRGKNPHAKIPETPSLSSTYSLKLRKRSSTTSLSY